MSVFNNVYVKGELFTDRVDGTDFTTADWAFLGTVNQNMATTDEVEFKSITLNNGSFTAKLQTAATASYTLTLPSDDGSANQVLTTDGSGVLSWAETANPFDQSLNTTDNVQFVDIKTTGDLTVDGDLTVSGTTTIINTTNTAIEDNIIILNNGETGATVTEGTAGLEIDRGTGTNYQLLFDEGSDNWTLGESGGVLGTGKFRIAELADASQTQGVIPGYDANGRLSEAEGLTAAEVDQLQKINAVTITNTQWAYLGNMDQKLTTTSNVTFNDVTINGDVTIAGCIAKSVSGLLTGDTNLSDSISRFDTSGFPASAKLPNASQSAGKCFTIILVTAGNDLTVEPQGNSTVEGLSNIVLDVARQHITVCSDGSNDWFIVS